MNDTELTESPLLIGRTALRDALLSISGMEEELARMKRKLSRCIERMDDELADAADDPVGP